MKLPVRQLYLKVKINKESLRYLKMTRMQSSKENMQKRRDEEGKRSGIKGLHISLLDKIYTRQ